MVKSLSTTVAPIIPNELFEHVVGYAYMTKSQYKSQYVNQFMRQMLRKHETVLKLKAQENYTPVLVCVEDNPDWWGFGVPLQRYGTNADPEKKSNWEFFLEAEFCSKCGNYMYKNYMTGILNCYCADE